MTALKVWLCEKPRWWKMGAFNNTKGKKTRRVQCSNTGQARSWAAAGQGALPLKDKQRRSMSIKHSSSGSPTSRQHQLCFISLCQTTKQANRQATYGQAKWRIRRHIGHAKAFLHIKLICKVHRKKKKRLCLRLCLCLHCLLWSNT